MKHLAIIDDKDIFLDQWDYHFSSSEVRILKFSDFFDFFKCCKKQNHLARKLDCIVSDKISPGFDAEQNHFGEDFRARYPLFQGKIILCSSLFRPGRVKSHSPGFDYIASKSDFEVVHLVREILFGK